MTSARQAPKEGHASSLLVRYGNFLFRYRDAVFPIVLLALIGLTRPRWPASSRLLDDLLDVAGVLIAIAGQTLRSAVVGYAYIIRGGKDRRVYAESLVTEGFFNHSRNPLYVGNMLVLLGLLLIWDSPVAYAAGIPFFLVGYMAIVAAEEEFLRRKFGAAFDAYCARTPRWTLRLRGIRQSLAGMTFQGRRVVRKEYGSAAYWIAAACALQLADSLYYLPWSARPVYHSVLVATILAVAAAWAVARHLKKSKQLGDIEVSTTNA